ncbi:MAG: DUF5610 domain-containing protein [Gammaproteobacteria bacterium]|jgi:hypothetical protein|nr:DUF5610 domain-containing protein [Gammaproteobacteria bacterium]MBT3722579.1 DUF5610 domain-containing protein [Gammaproteobacteria bacterium]MBT4076788.1 DUF5610 domain-containing protein [Gammaproteobacteria bacterium]MBT4193199.1 DUF5610 domain-containing protein [Gammaproteobacteria bacterium]MBT4451090.1 DUF5610 domain-containing protein [Gammaproteobacteria bacterium]
MSDLLSSFSANSIQADQSFARRATDNKPQTVTEMTPAQQQKASMNVSILESAAVIIGVKDEPLSLVLNSAIERINEYLAPELGENAIQKGVDSGLDVSPEATAERIASLSTSFYAAFKEQHPGEDEATVLTSFIETISSGIEKGFGEARDILEGLDVLEGGIASDIDQTFELVQEKLAAFEAMILDMNEFTESEEMLDA